MSMDENINYKLLIATTKSNSQLMIAENPSDSLIDLNFTSNDQSKSALDQVDELILKYKKAKLMLSPSQEGYKELIALHGQIIRDLINLKDLL